MHSEIHLRPWHAFSREGAWYVVNKKRFISDCAPPSFCRFLEDLERNPTLPVPPDIKKRLIHLQLIQSAHAEGNSHVPMNKQRPEPPVKKKTRHRKPEHPYSF